MTHTLSLPVTEHAPPRGFPLKHVPLGSGAANRYHVWQTYDGGLCLEIDGRQFELSVADLARAIERQVLDPTRGNL